MANNATCFTTRARYLQKSVKRGQRGEAKRRDEGYKSLQLNILSDGLVDG